MSNTATETRSIIVERELAFPPEKIWRALTQSHLIGEWLMQCDFAPNPGHNFKFSADWGEIECQVQTVEYCKELTYSWVSRELASVVTWTLQATENGTHLKMVQTGFLPDQQRAYMGAKAGWPQFLSRLEGVVSSLE